MFDFFNTFIGEALSDYPFIGVVCSVIVSSVIFFMFYTIVANLFKMR